jgi:hypothetical protein
MAVALNCAMGVDPQTGVSIAKAESGLNPLAVHDNTVGMSYAPETPDEAIKVATRSRQCYRPKPRRYPSS